MGIAEELKRKRTELIGDMEQLAHRIETIKKQVAAIDQVIAIYDPVHKASPVAKANQKLSRQEAPLPAALVKLNKSAAILEVLREAGEPLSSAECTSRIASRHGVAADDPALPRFVTHISAGLSSLVKRNRVRQVGTVGGRKNLWEITR
ncbi:hypothetical protein [Microvirga guangxiensis]|uniref:Uncharacterized protein n=1 Tax=Microvirga guangxiensis TaxID=549386 RepID=A0A1G5LJ67_9HYPH|nr:hypothetical protein [Microvirga guangxiensis]SCZ12674.1 hypothetical protein SAMN02927923_04366 [Microvirga guangxiensis]